MTKEAIEKLNEKQIRYCKTLSCLISRDRERNLSEQLMRDSGKLRGFLECLCQMELITGYELKTLYLWFFEKNRSDII